MAIYNPTTNVNVITSVLPDGGSDTSSQAAGNASNASMDSKTPGLGQALAASSIPVVLTAAQLTTLTPLSTVTTNLGTIAGVSTSAKQDTGNTSVASIDTKTPTLGQALAASSVPIVLTASQLTTLTPPSSITGFALEAGHLAAIDTSTAKIPALGQALAASSVPIVLTAAQLTTLTPPAAITGFALEAGHLAAIDTATARIPAQGQALAASSLPVVLTAAQITTLTPVSTVTANAGTNLNTSLLALEAGHLATIDTSTAKIPSQGQALAASSMPVVLTAAQITTLTPPAAITGFATSAKQDTGNTSLSSLDTKAPALGQALAASSVPVVLTAAQLTTLTPVSTVTANAGTNLNTSLLALEAGGNLATIVTNTGKIPAQGQALASASTPVVLTAAQITTLTPLSTVTTNDAALVSDVDLTLTSGATSQLSQTTAGRLRVDMESTARDNDGISAIYVNDRMARRLQEQIVLEMYESSFRNLMTNESYGSQRMGYEVR